MTALFSVPEESKKGKPFPGLKYLKVFFILILFCFPCCSKRQLTETSPQVDAAPEFWIRVLLLDDVNNVRLGLNSSFSIVPGGNSEKQHFSKPDRNMIVNLDSYQFAINGQNLEGGELTIEPDEPYIFTLNESGYRGKLRLIVNPDGSTFDVVNLVPLEPYLAGVIGAEMPNYWEPAALEAQAIAARTYCLYIKRRFGQNRHWDITKNQSNQVYIGMAAESGQVWKAINQTYGQVLVCKNPDGTTGIFPAYYSSSCGGHTEDSQNVFGEQTPQSLKGVPCPYCQYVAKPDFFLWPMVKVDKAFVSQMLINKYPTLNRLEKIVSIIPDEQGDYVVRIDNLQSHISRLTRIKLAGSNGKTDVLRAEDLRSVIDPTGRKIKSTIFKINDVGDYWVFSEGRGWGHGVGMCQCGAQAMARMEMKTAKQILSYYYPGSSVEYVYKEK